MIKGSFILEFTTEDEWKMAAQYIPAAEEKPDDALLDRIVQAFCANPTLTNLNFRQFPYKIFTIPLTTADKTPHAVLSIIIDATETLEIVKLFTEATKDTFRNSLGKPKELIPKLQQLCESRNALLDKLEKPKILQDQIGAQANKLIDQGKFPEAQAIIKLAKEIPAELVGAYKIGVKEFKAGSFKTAEKKFTEAFQLAEKINDRELLEYLALKVETARQIPSYQKELKSLLSNIVKPLQKPINNLPYKDQLVIARRTYEIFDILENDDKMTQITELEKNLEMTAALIEKIKQLDTQLKSILTAFAPES